MDAKTTLGESRLLISRTGLAHNVAVLRRTVGPDVKLCGIIKADAYGHDARLVADVLCNFIADSFEAPLIDQLAVATVEEALDLGAQSVPVLVMRPVENVYLGRQRESFERAIRAGLVLTLTHPAAADDLARLAVQAGVRIAINVMLDTGMNREGCAPDQLPALLDRIHSHAGLSLEQIGTHFATGSTERDAFAGEQLLRFGLATDDLEKRFGRPILRHAANSAATFASPPTRLDMVRPGLALYGIDPLLKPTIDRPIAPVMKWTAPLIGIRAVAAGESVGYDRAFVAPHDMTVGLVPVGYADGYPRLASDRGTMIVHNTPCKVVGRVSMDLTTIDLSRVDSPLVGDEVTVLDANALSPCSVYRLAEWAQTIPYEIFTGIGPRVKRVAVQPEDEPSCNEKTGLS